MNKCANCNGTGVMKCVDGPVIKFVKCHNGCQGRTREQQEASLQRLWDAVTKKGATA